MENNSKSFEKKKTVPEQRKLRFKDMRRGFAAHEKTHVLWGGELTVPWEFQGRGAPENFSVKNRRLEELPFNCKAHGDAFW